MDIDGQKVEEKPVEEAGAMDDDGSTLVISLIFAVVLPLMRPFILLFFVLVELEEGEVVDDVLRRGLEELAGIDDEKERIEAMAKLLKSLANRLESLSPKVRALFDDLARMLHNIGDGAPNEIGTGRICMFLGESGEGKSFIQNLLLLLSFVGKSSPVNAIEDLRAYNDIPDLAKGTLRLILLQFAHYFLACLEYNVSKLPSSRRHAHL